VTSADLGHVCRVGDGNTDGACEADPAPELLPGVAAGRVHEKTGDKHQDGYECDEHDQAYRRFIEASKYPSGFTDIAFSHPRTWWKDGMRHAADTSERARPGEMGLFFVIAPCHEYSLRHRAIEDDIGAVTCLLCIMITTEPR